MQAQRSSETSGTTLPSTQCHIPEEETSKARLSVCTSRKRVWGEKKYRSTCSWRRHWMEMSWELHVPADLPCGKKPWYSSNRTVSSSVHCYVQNVTRCQTQGLTRSLSYYAKYAVSSLPATRVWRAGVFQGYVDTMSPAVVYLSGHLLRRT
jgi:hypothetical protein